MTTAEEPAPIGVFAWNAWSARAGTVDLTRAGRPARTVLVEAEPQRIGIDLARCALVVIDMQREFCSPGGWVDHRGGDLALTRAPIGPLVTLLPVLRRSGVPVVWVSWGNRPDRANLPPGVLHVVNPDGHSVGIGDELPGSGSRVLLRGSWSTAIVDELVVDPSDLRVDKYRISGFWDTELDSVLRNLGVATLLFGGVNLDQCVLATLTDAACIGYDCILLEDCSGTTSPRFCVEATLYNVRRSLGFVIDSPSLLRAIEGGAP